MSKVRMSQSFNDQKGRINVEGKEAAQFWIRALKLEDHIAFVQSKLMERPERKSAASPIISEFKIDEDFAFIYALSFTIDVLGAHDVIGMVFYCSPNNRAKALELRDKLADQMLESLREAKFEEEIPMETFMTEPQSEAGGNQPPAS